MLKRTIYVGSPSYIHLKNRQLVFENKETKETKQCPMEDIGFLVLDNNQTNLYCGLLGELARENVAVITCNAQHMPQAVLTSMSGNHIQAEVIQLQVHADLPLQKRLWKQTIEAKIHNQIALLKKLGKNIPAELKHSLLNVKSGDSSNRESVAARMYWKNLFNTIKFQRAKKEEGPNNYLNYGYAILRAALGRALVGSGLNLSLGIHHSNKYNSYSLVDDIMEPYRPFVDEVAYRIFETNPHNSELKKEQKAELLEMLSSDVFFDNKKRPFMNGLSLTTASLVRCLRKEDDKVIFPKLQ